MRWADAGIIKTGGGGSQGKRREFTVRNLIEIVVCDELRGLGMNEPRLHRTVRDLNTMWNQPDDPTGFGPAKYRDATILWLAFQRYSDPEMEIVATYPVTADNLIKRLTTGESDGSGVAESGIAIPIRRIVLDLEAKTGDRLA
jgi:hypothetical protein